MEDAAWLALALSLTVLGGIWTWISFRRRGARSGLRALAVTLLPLAAYFTDTLQMVTAVATEVGDWATSLAFNPVTWLGITLAGLSVVLFVVAGRMRPRAVDRASGTPEIQNRTRSDAKRPAIAQDDDMAEIEALLRKRGIS
ncbi:cellulose synthase [Nocardioides sp. MAH-18]|uniref:Cellulose synthase n=1 Tax=Nocardioides agri TaxID=2682843 RepID=A0A6L6XLR9_9ACTN|nr:MULTISPECIES: cellulose synthase [unclassified Nocardioides]MBA2952988.1 cellulose synthase [Nocardioides sp. CGMCC 1.13656]MVQ47858.1 cellulose synthase [Nocardioides sp. MAH-18]